MDALRFPSLSQRAPTEIGLDDDSSEEEASEGECLEEEVSDGELSPDLSSEDDDDYAAQNPSGSFIAADGTRWTDRVPRTPMEMWRFALSDLGSGPDGEFRNWKNKDSSPEDVFRKFITDDVVEDVVKWTNKYGEELATTRNKMSGTTKKHEWRKTDATELRAFFGLVLLSGLEKPHRKPWSELWSRKESVRSAPFVATMSLQRFYEIAGALRFDDVAKRHEKVQEKSKAAPSSSRSSKPIQETEDKLEPIREIFERVNKRFSMGYVPGYILSVDEQLIKFRGRCRFRVYMKSKPGKYGLKIWAVVDVASGYILKLDPYIGRKQQKVEKEESKSLSTQVVLNLVRKYEGSGREIVADNYFSSLELVKELLKKGLTYCGTMRASRKGIPPVIKRILPGCEANTFLFNEEDQLTLLRHVYKGRRFVLLITSAHFDNDFVDINTSHGEKSLPAIIHDYNCNTFGVDRANQMISYYTGQFPTRRWPLKLFIHLLDVAAINAYVVWIANDPSWEQHNKSRRRLFLRDLAYQLIRPHIERRAATTVNLPHRIIAAMRIMGVVYSHAGHTDEGAEGSQQPERPPTAGMSVPRRMTDARLGRCPFDSTVVRHQKPSRRQCKGCSVFVCASHWVPVCPECYPDGFTSTEESAAVTEGQQI